MQELFVGYEQALKLRSLGFDEECLAWYFNDKINNSTKLCGIYALSESKRNSSFEHLYETKDFCTAPLYQQAFDWLCKRINLSTTSWSLEFTESGWDLIHVDKATYEIIDIFRNEAALNKLIEIVENEQRKKSNPGTIV